MSLTLKLGKEVPGHELIDLIGDLMSGMDGFKFRSLTGNYMGESQLSPGYLLLFDACNTYNKPLDYNGQVSVYKKTKGNNCILEMRRKNKEYSRKVNRINIMMFFPPVSIIGIPSAILMNVIENTLDADNVREYRKVTYDDNVFVELDPDKNYSKLEFHVNVLHPKFGGGTVKRLDDFHFQPLRSDFENLCEGICSQLNVDYELVQDGAPYREGKLVLPIYDESGSLAVVF